MSLHTELRELEERFWGAAGDAEFWNEHFADEGVIALAMGLMDKRTVVEAQTAAGPWATYALDDVRIVELADQVASISYRATARRTGDDGDYVAVVTSVYVRRDGDWVLAVHQQTPVG
jgi:hypothetical protein